MLGWDSLNRFAGPLTVTCSTKCSRLISAITAIFIIPEVSGKKPVTEQSRVETFQRFLPKTLEVLHAVLKIYLKLHAAISMA